MSIKIHKHPCFSDTGHKIYARMHLPVAPACNIQCNYCHRDYDCVNESRPGVTSEILTPGQSLDKFLKVKEKVQNLSVIGFAGPGDALANFDKVKKTIELISGADPEVLFCLSTNGLMLPHYAEEIVNSGITHVTITINAIDRVIGGKIYEYINYRGKVYTGEEAAEILIKNQLQGLKYLAERDIICKVNIVAIKDINEGHIEEIAKKVKALGAFKTNIMQLIPAPNTKFENVEMLSNKRLNEIRKKCSGYISQMYHCRQCRADAIGLLHRDRSVEFRGGCSSRVSRKTSREDIYVFAVATSDGKIIDQHFGQVEEFFIYKFANNKIELIDKRKVPRYCTGKEDCEDKKDYIISIADTLKDCAAVLSMRIGSEPKAKLKNAGFKVFEIYDTVQNGIIRSSEAFAEIPAVCEA